MAKVRALAIVCGPCQVPPPLLDRDLPCALAWCARANTMLRRAPLRAAPRLDRDLICVLAWCAALTRYSGAFHVRGAGIWGLNTGNGSWWRLETNFDHWGPVQVRTICCWN